MFSDYTNYLPARTLGFDELFKTIDRLASVKIPSFPPHNVLKTDDGFKLELAVAGYTRDDLYARFEKGILTVGSEGRSSDDAKYVHRGLAARAFDIQFQVADTLEISDVALNEGILTVVLKEKPKTETSSTLLKIK